MVLSLARSWCFFMNEPAMYAPIQENEYAGAANAAPVLYVEEAELFVESLREFSIEEIGNSRCEKDPFSSCSFCSARTRLAIVL